MPVAQASMASQSRKSPTGTLEVLSIHLVAKFRFVQVKNAMKDGDIAGLDAVGDRFQFFGKGPSLHEVNNIPLVCRTAGE